MTIRSAEATEPCWADWTGFYPSGQWRKKPLYLDRDALTELAKTLYLKRFTATEVAWQRGWRAWATMASAALGQNSSIGNLIDEIRAPAELFIFKRHRRISRWLPFKNA